MPPETTSPPAARPNRVRFLTVPFVRLYSWYVHQPRLIRIGLAAVSLAGILALGVYAQSHRKKRAAAEAVAAAWREVEEAVRQADRAAARQALDRVLAANPEDPTAARFRDMLDQGAADPDTPELVALLLTDHLRADRLPEAAREAGKLLSRFPKHWQARCCLAHAALQLDRNPGRAEELLRQLPDPEDPEARVSVGGLLYALRLCDVLGADPTALRQVIVRRLVPLLRTAAASTAPARAKAQLLTCYLEPFADPNNLTQLADFWAAADKLAEEAVDQALADADTPTLTTLAELGPRMRLALARLRDNDPARLPDDRFLPLQRAIDDRTRRAWHAVLQKKPDSPEAYRGLATLALHQNDPGTALRTLLDGLAACGDRTELLDPLLGIVARLGTPEGLRNLTDALLRSAEQAGTDPARWCLAATAAELVGRADIALDACRRARAVRPDDPWACATEARLWLRTGDFVRASEALAPLGTASYSNPALARLRGRLLVDSGLWVLRDDELNKVRTAARNNPAAVVGFLLGVHDAPPDAARAAWVAAQAERLLADTPDLPRAARLRAEALFRLAELSATLARTDGSPPVWNPERVTAALRAFDQLPPAERAEPAVLASVALLLLKGKADAPAALRSLAGLLKPDATLDPRQIEVVGAALLANDRLEPAVRLLEQAVQRPNVPAGCHITLGLAYLRQGRWADAQAQFAAAQNIPDRSDREHAELIAAKLRFQKERP
jgi:hypothetical protein